MANYYTKTSRYKYISFDMFDTLIKRNVVCYNDVFEIVGKRYQRSYSSFDAKKFVNDRHHAYSIACQENKNCTLDDIYGHLPYANEIRESLKALEIQTEIEICVPNKKITNLYQDLKEKGKIVLIITDMYLPKWAIQQILEKCEIEYEQNLLFVSCEIGLRKTDGGLYDYVCKKLCIQYKELLHIGDGLKNDVIRAKMKGIHAIWVHGSFKRNLSYYNAAGLSPADKVSYDRIGAIINNYVPCEDTEFSKLGFEIMGPLVYGFILWLYRQLKKDNIKKVYFLAREGQILKKAFQEIINDEEIEVYYLYASRRSIVVPTIWQTGKLEDIPKILACPYIISVGDIIRRCGLDTSVYEKKLYDNGIDLNYKCNVNEIALDEKMQKAFGILQKDIIRNSFEEYCLLEKYLKQVNISGRIGIVDIGWNGSMQKALESFPYIKNNHVEIHGYYFGINGSKINTKFKFSDGFLYNEKEGSNYRYDIYGFAGPFEMAFAADHGTVRKFQSKLGDEVVPVLESHEYMDVQGNALHELQYAIEMQKGMMHFINIIKKCPTKEIINFTRDVAFHSFHQFGIAPCQKHLKMFDTYKAIDMGNEQILIDRRYHKMYGEYSFMHGLKKSTWKLGMMRYIFKIPFHYEKVYSFLRRSID